MTKKHFTEIAEIVSGIGGPVARAVTAQRFADLFEKLYPRFDRRKFLAACNPV